MPVHTSSKCNRDLIDNHGNCKPTSEHRHKMWSRKRFAPTNRRFLGIPEVLTKWASVVDRHHRTRIIQIRVAIEQYPDKFEIWLEGIYAVKYADNDIGQIS